MTPQPVVRYFRLIDFACPCCSRVRVALPLVLLLDALRSALSTPLRITSGYRCLGHNAAVGGTTKSRHLIGCAADVVPICYRPGWYDRIAPALVAFGLEVVTYADRPHLHIGVPRAFEDPSFDWLE